MPILQNVFSRLKFIQEEAALATRRQLETAGSAEHPATSRERSAGTEIEAPHDPVAAGGAGRAIHIIIPFYKKEELVPQIFASLNRIADEIRDIGAEVFFYNDSPDYAPLQQALDRCRFDDDKVGFHIIRNDHNLGFIGTCNAAFDNARRAHADVILLNSDTVVFPGAFREMREVAYLDPMIGFVCPRSNNATLATLPHSSSGDVTPEYGYAAFKQHAAGLPRFSWAPTAVGFCLFVKWSVYSEVGAFDPVYGAGYNEENDLIMRANRCGYRAVLANQAFVWHQGEQSFSESEHARTAREEHNAPILRSRYPEYLPLVEAYFASPEYRAEELMEYVNGKAGELTIAFDFSSFGPYFNGTFEAGLKLLDAATRVWPRHCRIGVYISPSAWRFHGLERFKRVQRLDFDDASSKATAIIRLGQPFKIEEVSRPFSRAPVVGIFMLDTIAYDCGYISANFDHNLWRYVFEHADVVYTNSRFTLDRISSRFKFGPRVLQRISRHSLDVSEYVSPYHKDTETNSHIFVIGNHFRHKFIRPTVDALAKAFPDRTVVAIGYGDDPSPYGNVKAYESGRISNDALERFYADAAVVIFPSHYEGFGFPIVHALARKRPIYVRDSALAHEIAQNLEGAENVHYYCTTDELVNGLRTNCASWIQPTGSGEHQGWKRSALEVFQALEVARGSVQYEDLVDRLRQLDLLLDRQELVRLKSSVNENDKEIAKLGQALSSREGEIKAIKSGKAWKLFSFLQELENTVNNISSRTKRVAAKCLRLSKALNQSAMFDAEWYLDNYPSVAKSGLTPLEHFSKTGWKEHLDPHPLFDTEWYLASYPDVAKANVNPLEHFLNAGWKEGRNPHPLFDTQWYLRSYPDILNAETNPLLHFLNTGWREMRSPHPLFDILWYSTTYPDVAKTGRNPLLHFLESGWKAGENPHPLFDTGWYRDSNRDVALAGINPILHFLKSGRREGRSPHPLFDMQLYLDINPDVGANKSIDPLLHFINFGWKEGRQTHPLFDAQWYLHTYPSVAKTGTNPLLYFLTTGWKEGHNPHPLFDTNWYLHANEEIEKRGLNPILHYIRWGAKELRDPSPGFDAKFYAGAHPDAATNPLLYHVRFGLLQGLPTRRIEQNISLYLPTVGKDDLPKTDVVVDIVIPVYRGLDETRRCIEAVLADRDRQPGTIRVIDDCSPEPELSNWLSSLAATGQIKFYRNNENLGFIATVNRGMRESGHHDVVLLNSDTQVPSGWLRRLSYHAYAGDKIGTVTPFSNNATICSYPTIGGGPLPQGYTLAELDTACRAGNFERSVEIPTAVGFCMYIRRDCLDEVGDFDVETFGKGYGEEADFCMRATTLGWRHVMACDTLVYHQGGVSFGSDIAQMHRAHKLVLDLHPQYEELLTQHFVRDPTKAPMFAATISLFDASGLPTLLMVSHNLHGGVEKHVGDLVSQLAGRANVVLLQPKGSHMELGVPSLPGHPTRAFAKHEVDDLLRLLSAFKVSRVHIHHVIGMQMDLHELIKRYGAPFDVTIHDYYTVCPRKHLLSTPEAEFCDDKPETSVCNACINQGSAEGATEIVGWRERHDWLFKEASRVICPSRDLRDRLIRFDVSGNFIVAPHEPVPSGDWPVTVPPLAEGEPLRIVILGGVAHFKGQKALENCARAADPDSIQFTVIGNTETLLPPDVAQKVHVTGFYLEPDLAELIKKARPHVFWFPRSCPETYSYTLTTAIDSGLPIVATGIGALPERLTGRPQTWIMGKSSCSTDDCMARFHEIAAYLRSGARPAPDQPRAHTPSFYDGEYLVLREQCSAC